MFTFSLGALKRISSGLTAPISHSFTFHIPPPAGIGIRLDLYMFCNSSSYIILQQSLMLESVQLIYIYIYVTQYSIYVHKYIHTAMYC